jgi:GNAT superfamily N-acetyltransferase
MGSSDTSAALPHAQSRDLHLSHPTDGECLSISKLTWLAWGDALSLPLYLEESEYLTSVPLARDGGMTSWILVDRNLPPDQRPILCSCETFRKRAMIGGKEDSVTEMIIHGVASVFCNPTYRGRGYASRMMMELADVLRTWQAEENECIGSVLYSDIGKTYYANLGWHPFPNNTHVEFPQLIIPKPSNAKQLLSADLDQLCKKDEAMTQNAMASASDGRIRMMLVPDLDHMLWHHKKEEFACDKLFGKQPKVKGAIAGQPGNRIWAIWTHRFYGDPDSASSGNTLYIIRLVIENQATASTISSEDRGLASGARQLALQAEQLKAVLQMAQAEAAEWKLLHVKLWDPTPLVYELIKLTGIQHCKIEREHEGIASLLWYGEGSGKEDTLEWIGNEKFAWC